ncbi:unnamed protein product [Euphydryas editha]|uniref:Uncharacterized protein n=1 Tax=Euphydryas editha TaxID=104508 RepID=A0AAU9UH64_EUPED|nr:unnamed protein product [Euphydryas editha]
MNKINNVNLELALIEAFVINNNDNVYRHDNDKINTITEDLKSDNNIDNSNSENSTNVFNGVYTECFVQLSYTCLQKKTLLYLKELNRLNEISVIGDYVKFVKLNTSDSVVDEEDSGESSDELSYMIDKAVDNFFDNHLIRFRALGKDVLIPNKVEEFVGRKRRKGGGGGHGGDGGDGGKKKMMMMAMMCMKMKLMVMVPAMMGMMGMMSFKGMMFSMMSFMISKMMLLMKILEKKGGGGSGGGGGDVGWAAGGGGGGAWMPAGGSDYGGGGGYDANGQWQSRSIIEENKQDYRNEEPIISYVKPIIRYNKAFGVKPMSLMKNLNEEVLKIDQKPKSRKRRGIIDVLQNAYLYWASKVLGVVKKQVNYPKYKIVNGVKYVYHPTRHGIKTKSPKDLNIKNNEVELKPIVVDDFNKGEIVEGPIESRMIRKKIHKMKENVNETVDENPWE